MPLLPTKTTKQKIDIETIHDAVWMGFLSSLPVFDYVGLPRYTGERLRRFRNVILSSAGSESGDDPSAVVVGGGGKSLLNQGICRVIGTCIRVKEKHPDIKGLEFWTLVREDMISCCPPAPAVAPAAPASSRDFDVQAVLNVTGYYCTAFRKGVDKSGVIIPASVPGGVSIYVLLAEWIHMIGGPPYTLTLRTGAEGKLVVGAAPSIQEEEGEKRRFFWECGAKDDEEEHADELAAARKKIEQLERRLAEQRDRAARELSVLRNEHGLLRANARSELRSARAEIEHLRRMVPWLGQDGTATPHFAVM
ncbi:hypothetical protein F5X96DRAFT_686349 [Biscogniauxia mediterranea]|nr:hypothetical protein F5X96DRAFT_686349 [Biscogniauxia mediterranea]